MAPPRIGKSICRIRGSMADASLQWIGLTCNRSLTGYRMITGQSQGSMMAMVTNMARIVVS